MSLAKQLLEWRMAVVDCEQYWYTNAPFPKCAEDGAPMDWDIHRRIWNPSAMVRLHGTPFDQDTIIKLAHEYGYAWTGTEYKWEKWDKYP